MDAMALRVSCKWEYYISNYFGIYQPQHGSNKHILSGLAITYIASF